MQPAISLVPQPLLLPIGAALGGGQPPAVPSDFGEELAKLLIAPDPTVATTTDLDVATQQPATDTVPVPLRAAVPVRSDVPVQQPDSMSLPAATVLLAPVLVAPQETVPPVKACREPLSPRRGSPRAAVAELATEPWACGLPQPVSPPSPATAPILDDAPVQGHGQQLPLDPPDVPVAARNPWPAPVRLDAPRAEPVAVTLPSREPPVSLPVPEATTPVAKPIQAPDHEALTPSSPVAADPAARLAPAVEPSPAALQTPSRPASPAAQVASVLVQLSHAPDGAQRLTVRLDPPELGHVQVRIERPPDAPARVEFVVEKPETLQLLLRDQPQLQRALDQAGVPAEGRSVTFHIASPEPAPRNEPGTAPTVGVAAGGLSGDGSHGPQRQGGQAGHQQGHTQDAGEVEASPVTLTGWMRGGLDITA